MPGSPEIERRIRTFSSIEDIVNAMKAYAGVTIKRTEEMVRAVRAYEEQVLRALAAVAGDDPELLVPEGRGGRILVVFGSSQGLCGPLNERVAEFRKLWFEVDDPTGGSLEQWLAGRAEHDRTETERFEDSFVELQHLLPLAETNGLSTALLFYSE